MKTSLKVLDQMVAEIVTHFGRGIEDGTDIEAVYDALPFAEFVVPEEEVAPVVSATVVTAYNA